MDALNLATILEKAASHIDATDGVAQREISVQTSARREKVAGMYRDQLGYGFTDEMRAKIASADDTTLDMLEKLASMSGAPASLGGPSDATPFPTPSGRVDPMAEFTATYSGPAR
jgi:hypothetical protein